MKSMDEWLTQPGGLANRLHSLRLQADLTGEQLVQRLGKGWTESKISKISRGKQLPTGAELEAWARTCGADAETIVELHGLLAEALSIHKELRVRMRLGQAPIQRTYEDMVAAAAVIRNAEVSYVPGLLQTPGYVRARMEENVRLYGADPAEVDAAVQARLRRQQALYDSSKRFEFVLAESCLRLVTCPPEVMRAQLDRLLSLADGTLSNVTLGVVPFGVPLTTTPHGGILLFDDVAAIETVLGDTIHEGTEAATYATVFEQMLAEAWTGAQARSLILDAIAALAGSTVV